MKRRMSNRSLPARSVAACLALAWLAGCGSLLPTPAPQPAFYALESGPAAAPAAPAVGVTAGPTLVINPPRAAPGFDSQRIIYVREPHKLEYFARHEWVDTPARMLAPLIVTAVGRSGAFHAVVSSPSAATGELRLDTELVRLQHDFGSVPSRVRLTLRAYLVDTVTRRVLASREFDETVAAASEDPYGGVLAANGAVRAVLDRLERFCAETAQGMKRPP